jgi:hypothetical protein
MNPTATDSVPFDWTYPAAFCWGLLILASFTGWGQLVGRWLISDPSDQELGWGLTAAWGMSVFLILAGPLIMFSIFSIVFLSLFLGAGLVLAVWQMCLRGIVLAGVWPRHWGLRILFVGLFLLVALTYAGAVAMHIYNPYDDFSAYFPFSKMLLDRGTLYDPFNFRILGALGGQQTLSTLLVAFLPWKYAHLLDMGIAALIVIGLTQDMARGVDSKAWIGRLFLVALALTFPMPRYNTASELTGVVLFLALLRSFEVVAAKQTSGWRAALLLGGVMTATSTLRCHNLFVVALLGMGFTAWRWWEMKKDRREVIRESLLTLVATIALLIPWWVVAYGAAGSFLYPLFKGTQRPDFDPFSSHLALSDTLQFIGGFFTSTSYLLLFVPICFLEPGRQRRLMIVLGGLLLFITAAFLSRFTSAMYSDLSRYLFPMGLAFGLYTTGLVTRQLATAAPKQRPLSGELRAVAAVILTSCLLFFQCFSFWDASFQNMTLIQMAVDARNPIMSFSDPARTDEAEREYREAFALIPTGAKTLIALDYPYLLDYQAHTIFSIDIPGAASPDPGLPYFHGAAPVKDYLLAQGIRYLVHVPFDQGVVVHNRRHQNENLNGPVALSRFYAPYELDLFDNVDHLAKTNRVLYDSPTIRVIDLGGR